MSLRIRLIAATICTATVVAAIAIPQIRKADADNQQPPASAQADSGPAAGPKLFSPTQPGNDTLYLDLVTPQKSTRAAGLKVRKALETPVTVQFKMTPLKEAVHHIAAKCGVVATLHLEALKEEGIADDEPVTLTRRFPAPARAVFNTLLDPLGLTVTVENGKLAITTWIDAGEQLDTRLYDTARLVKAGFTQKSLTKLIQQETSGPWGDIDGTGGTIDDFEQVLIVRQTEKIHAETTRLLNTMQRIVEGPEKSGTAPLGMTPEDHKVYAALYKSVTVDFVDTPLTQVAATIGKPLKIDVLLDENSLAEEGIATNENVTASFKEVQLKSTLKQILEPLGLDYYVIHGVLMIAAEIVAEERQYPFVLNVRDFSEAGYDSDALVETVMVESSGPWQDIDGTGGVINTPLSGLLVVRQTWRCIEDCALHLEKLRTILKQSTADGRLPKSTADPKTAGLILKQYYITSLPIEDVRNAIPKLVAADTWKSAGGRGELAILESKLIVHQTHEVHEEIEEFLEQIGEGLGAIGTPLNGDKLPFGIGTPGGGFFNVK